MILFLFILFLNLLTALVLQLAIFPLYLQTLAQIYKAPRMPQRRQAPSVVISSPFSLRDYFSLFSLLSSLFSLLSSLFSLLSCLASRRPNCAAEPSSIEDLMLGNFCPHSVSDSHTRGLIDYAVIVLTDVSIFSLCHFL